MDLREKVAIIHNLISVKKFTQAITNCNKLIKQNPNNSYLYNLCGLAHQGNKQISKSIIIVIIIIIQQVSLIIIIITINRK